MHNAQMHNIWLAGLGAMARAQAEGSKAFDALVKQGVEWQSQAREHIAEATQRAGALEGIFEQRVARALAGLGLPTALELAELRARVQTLEKALEKNPPARRAAAKKPTAKKPAAKTRASKVER
jgi:polyhydroxyalkanoate synthesis regulator phasin